MKINWVDYSCEIYQPIEEEKLIENIEDAYRICYNTTDKMKNETIEESIKFIQSKMALGHGSPLEHFNISMTVIIDRGILAEWTRSRVGSSYSVESTRYCKYKDNIECILPVSLRADEDRLHYEIFVKSVENSCNAYNNLLDLNITPQIARGVLPMSLKTKMRVTHNVREWFHILDLRYWGIYGSPHPDFRYCMHKVYKELQKYYPNIFNKYYLADQEELVNKYSKYDY